MAVYFVQGEDGTVRDAAGIGWLTVCDACKVFTQITNTARVRQMLAILARSGQGRPRFLSFWFLQGPGGFFLCDRPSLCACHKSVYAVLE